MATRRIKVRNAERYLLVDEQSYSWAVSRSWFVDAYGNAYTNVYKKDKTKHVKAHKAILWSPRGMEIDHINGNALDNRLCNLRITTRSQNARNNHGRNSKYRYKGIHFKEGRGKEWGAVISFSGKQKFLGSFNSKIAAARAYDRAATKYFGNYANTNFPTK